MCLGFRVHSLAARLTKYAKSLHVPFASVVLLVIKWLLQSSSHKTRHADSKIIGYDTLDYWKQRKKFKYGRS